MITSNDLGRAAQRWYASGFADDEFGALKDILEEANAEPPPNVCHWCDKTDDDNYDDGYGPLVDIRVIIADREEGNADVLRWSCQEHMEKASQALCAIGFADHRHGGINFLEPQDCPGYTNYGSCPTPATEDA